MSDINCKNCCYGGVCQSSKKCNNFAPITDDMEDEAIERFIEKERARFRTEWYQYISQFDN